MKERKEYKGLRGVSPVITAEKGVITDREQEILKHASKESDQIGVL